MHTVSNHHIRSKYWGTYTFLSAAYHNNVSKVVQISPEGERERDRVIEKEPFTKLWIWRRNLRYTVYDHLTVRGSSGLRIIRALSQWRTQEFFSGGGGQQIQLKTEGRENGDLGAVAPSQGFHSICKWRKPVSWLGYYGCIFQGTGNSA
jgi:hypothetical protein